MSRARQHPRLIDHPRVADHDFLDGGADEPAFELSSRELDLGELGHAV